MSHPPSTLLSRQQVEIAEVSQCSAEILAEMLLSKQSDWSPQMLSTLSATIKMCMNHARGTVLVLVGEQEAFKSVFCDDEDGEASGIVGPTMWSADGGYMAERLRNIHVSDPRFVEAFQDYTNSSDRGSWPEDPSDKAAPRLDKCGALVLDATGYRIKCAANILGIPTPAVMGRKVSDVHNTAMACAWAVSGCIGLVRDSDGSLDGVVWSEGGPCVYHTAPLSSHANGKDGGQESQSSGRLCL
jgi:hypothetical protein